MQKLFIYTALFCCAIVGCGGGESVKVTVDGEGLVISSPGGIRCGQGNTQCTATFTEAPVVLTASPPTDGSYAFSRWEGGCAGSTRTCSLSQGGDVTAIFVSSGGADNRPTAPANFFASPMSSSTFFVQWDAGTDQISPRPALAYKLYASSDSDNIVSEANLIATIDGSSASRYSYDLDVIAEGLLTTEGTYHIAVATVDEEGYQSEASILANLTPLEKDIQIQDGVLIHSASDAGYPQPAVTFADGEETYTYSDIAGLALPVVGDYVAQLVEDSGLEYHELLRVISVTDNGFTATVAGLAEITAEPYAMSGSININSNDDPLENEGPVESIAPEFEAQQEAQQAERKPDPELMFKSFSPEPRSVVDCGESENISKVSISASSQRGIDLSVDYRISVLGQEACSDPALCENADDFVRASLDINGQANASINMKGGECFRAETLVGFEDKDIFDRKLFRGLRFKGGRFRVTMGLKYSLDASASSNIELGNRLSLEKLGFSVDIKDKEVTPSLHDPEVKVIPTVSLSGALDYTIKISPFFKMNLDVKVAGMDYEGEASTILEGAVSARSISERTPEDIYLDNYTLDFSTNYVHSFTPVLLLLGYNAIEDEVAYESDAIPIFGLPSSSEQAVAESFQNDEMCRITYQYQDGTNNPLEESPFRHYLLFDDLSEVPVTELVSVTKTDDITKYVYEIPQEKLYTDYVLPAKEKEYKRVARGQSLIGDTVVDNVDWKKQ